MLLMTDFIIFGLMVSYEVNILLPFHACSVSEWLGFQNFEFWIFWYPHRQHQALRLKTPAWG